jgi:uracil-DNA glycosylase family 4
MKTCSLCSEASNFNYCLKGERADAIKFLFVLHRADRRIHEYFEGYWGALKNSATGIILDDILKEAELDFDDILLTNFFKCLLPEDRRPSKQEYFNCLTLFQQQVQEFNPRAIVIFGNRPYQCTFPKRSKLIKITELKEELNYEERPCLVSMHPSQIWKKLSPELKGPYIRRVANFLKKYKE